MAKAKKDKPMSNDINELLDLPADLGTEVDATSDASDTSDEFEFADLPTTTRNREGGGSKYAFEKFPAPKSADGPFAQKLIPYGTDAAKTKRSVQSAVTAANRSGKAKGVEFRTRDAAAKNGILIIRVK